MHKEGRDACLSPAGSQAPASAREPSADKRTDASAMAAKGTVTWAYTVQVTRVWVTLPVRPLGQAETQAKGETNPERSGRREEGRAGGEGGAGAFTSTQRCSQRSWEPGIGAARGSAGTNHTDEPSGPKPSFLQFLEHKPRPSQRWTLTEGTHRAQRDPPFSRAAHTQQGFMQECKGLPPAFPGQKYAVGPPQLWSAAWD